MYLVTGVGERPMGIEKIDTLVNEIEHGFMQSGGWNNCRHLLKKLTTDRDAEIEKLFEELKDMHHAGCEMAELLSESQKENIDLYEKLAERTLQHKVQLDNAVRLDKELRALKEGK